jgi:hypothetical protein
MAHKTWQVIKVRYCEHAGTEVSMEAQLIFPADFLPEQAPRVVAHRCSQALTCNLDGRASCVWAGTNPNFDPFAESDL